MINSSTSRTSFSSVTNPTIQRPRWHCGNAQEDPSRNIRVKIPNRFRSNLPYDCFNKVNPVSIPPPSSPSTTTPRSRTSFRRQSAVSTDHTASKDPPPPNHIATDEESIKRTLNVDEIKWFQHRWLGNHGKNSGLKEHREKMVLLRRWFDSLDTDGSGEIGLDELEDPLVSVGLARDREDVRKLIQHVAKSCSGEVNFQDFLNLMNPKKSTRPRVRHSLDQLPPFKTTSITDDFTIKSAGSSSRRVMRAHSIDPVSSPGKQTRCLTSPAKHFTATADETLSGEAPYDLEGADNPIVKLFSDLQSGKLGDLAIPFPVLITAHRRRMLLNAHMAEDPMARTLGASVLQALENTRRKTTILNGATSSQEIQGNGN